MTDTPQDPSSPVPGYDEASAERLADIREAVAAPYHPSTSTAAFLLRLLDARDARIAELEAAQEQIAAYHDEQALLWDQEDWGDEDTAAHHRERATVARAVLHPAPASPERAK